MPRNDGPHKDADDKDTVTVAEGGAGVTEGDIHAARDAAAVTRNAGHWDTEAIWRNSPEGQEFLEKEAPRREKEAKEEAKKAEEDAKRSEKAMEAYEATVREAAEQAKTDQEDTRKANEKKENNARQGR